MGALYALEWALDVLESFRREHARATDVVCKFFDISEGNLITIVRTPGPSWKNFKIIVKALDRNFSCQLPSALNEELIHKLALSTFEWAVGHGYIRNKEALDRVKKVCEPTRAPNEGSLSEETSDGTQLLLGFGV